MRFHADDRVLRGGEALCGASKDLCGDVELGQLILLLLKVLGTHVFEQSRVPSASAQKLDGTIKFSPLSVS